jgi:hypothetical protein
MAWLLALTRSSRGRLSAVENSDAGTMNLRCYITNYYFYFRLVAFVNCDILLDASRNVVEHPDGVRGCECIHRNGAHD